MRFELSICIVWYTQSALSNVCKCRFNNNLLTYIKKNMKTTGVLLGIILTIGSVGSAIAKDHEGCALVYSGTASMEGLNRATYLKTGEYKKLDTELEGLLSEHVKGRRADLFLTRDVVELLAMVHGEEGTLTDWVEKNPNSFFANLANGSYHTNRGSNLRGTNAASKTKASQFSAMKEEHLIAEKYLNAALKLKPNSALPYAGLIAIAANQSGNASADKLFKAALQADPKSLSARVSATSYLSPRWGGSLEQLDGILAEAAAAKLPEPHLYYLKYNATVEKASHFEVIAKDKKSAYLNYKEALAMCSNSSGAPSGMARTVR
jgi:tetratricopeptide (TPR) repeat protein